MNNKVETEIIDAPYELPEGWKWVNVGSIAEVINGKNQKEVEDENGLYPIYGSGGIIGRAKDFICPENCTIIGRKGTINNPIFVETKFWNVDTAFGMKPFNSVNPKFYFYFCKNFNFSTLDSSTAIPSLTKTNIQKIPFPLPPTIKEQHRIVNRIESMFAKLDEAKEKAQNVVDSFELRKAAILHQAFTGNLTAKWRKENSVSDDSWEEKLFDSCIAKMQNGLSKRSGEEGEETVVLRLANIGENDFDVSDLRTINLTSKEQENYSLIKDDVVMIRVNGSKANVGRQILVKNNNGWSFCDHIIRIKFESFCLPNYMVYYSNTKEYKDYVQDNMVSSAGQNTISRKGLSNLTLKIPTLSEQQEIVRVLDSVFEKECIAKSAAEQILEQIDLLKKSILAKAFRGEL